MATSLNTSQIPVTFKTLGGGLNTASGPLNVQDNEATDLQNIDFDKFGSILKRKGYSILNPSPVSGTAQGIYWYNGLSSRYAIMVGNGKIYKMDELDGTWDDITGAYTFSSGVDAYTKLLLHCEGADEGTTFTDSSGSVKTVTNTETYDSYTVLMLHAENTDAVKTFTDISLGTHSFYTFETQDDYTVLMLHLNGADGIVTFTDVSLSTHTVLAAGTAQIDTAQSKFGGASLLLDGNSDYLTIADSDNWNFSSSNFTIDFFVRFSALPVANESAGFFHQNPVLGNTDNLHNAYLYYNGVAYYVYWTAYSGASNLFALVPEVTVAVDTWYHFAFVRYGNNLYIYQDGVQVGTTAFSGSIPDLSAALEIGRNFVPYYLNGWIDEFRVSKGVARWTKDFMVPTTEHPNIAISTSNKKFGSSSIYFDGAGYIYSSDSNDWFLTNTNFTLDFFSMFNVLPTAATKQYIVSQYASSTSYWNLALNNSTSVYTWQLNFYSASDLTLSFSDTPSTSTWNHYALVRSSTVFTMYKDGVSLGTQTNAASILNIASNFNIGQSNSSGYFNGFIDEMRLSRDIVRWNSNFQPPTVPYGKVGITSQHKKVDSAGGEFKGYERLSLADSADFYFSTGSFTIDFYVKFNNIVNASVFSGQYEDGNNYWYIHKDTNANGNKLRMKFVDGAASKGEYVMTGNWAVTINQWYHIAFVRNTATGIIFIDGVSQTLTETTAFGVNDVGDMAATLIIGHQNNSSFLDGWIDEFRISKGVARWTSNFTPGVASSGDYTKKEDFETFLNYVLGTDDNSTPWQWTESSPTATAMTVVSGLSTAKFIKKFQNYCFVGNVTISGVKYASRIYWSGIKSITTWAVTDYIDVSYEDGDEITGMKELGDRLVIYKNNSIYVLLFTGDPDVPFILQKTNSSVGCSSPFSIQANENGHIFVSYDGVYFFDGFNSYKLSDRINDLWDGISDTQLYNAVSMYQKKKNKYWLSLSSGTSLYNNYILTWDSFLNSWSKYSGFSASAMAIFMVNGSEERPYFTDYNGYSYRADYGNNDTPLKTTTAIDAYWQSNWKHFEDVCDSKGIPHVYVVHRNESSTVLTLNYSFDFYNGNQYTQSFSMLSLQSVTALTTRRDLTGRGKFVSIKLRNNTSDVTFRIDGLGTYVSKESRS